MKRKKDSQRYDIIVIGAGAGGLTSAVGCARLGKKVALVERDNIGGECTNSGCVPSKALLHYAKAYAQARKIYRGDCKDSAYLRREALEYARKKIKDFRASEQPEDFQKYGIDIVFGEAIFESAHTVRVGDTVYAFAKAIIATGSSPRKIEVPGLREEDTLTNQNFFLSEEIPKKVLILGAGPMGLEIGQACAMTGADVTIVSRSEDILSGADKEVRRMFWTMCRESNMKIMTGAEIVSVQNKTAKIRTYEGAEKRVPFDKLLMAIGRVPNIPRGLEEIGIDYNNDIIETNTQAQTSQKNIYAIGDVASQVRLTHVADDLARQVVAHIASHGMMCVKSAKAVPQVLYTQPEVARVGMTYGEAKIRYGEGGVARIVVSFDKNDRARVDERVDGCIVVYARKFTGSIIGAQIIGESAGEIIGAMTMAIDHKISLWRLRRTIFAYPTYGLIIKRVGDVFLAQSVANFRKDSFYFLKKNSLKGGALIVWVGIIVAFYRYQITHNLSAKEMVSMLYTVVTTTTWGPIAYMAVYAVRPIVFFPATLLTLLSGAIFGLPLGIIYTVIGENASANLAYWIGRFFGADMIKDHSALAQWVQPLRKRPFMTVLFMRLFYMPFDLTNYIAGIIHVRWAAYATATFIGIMPGLVTFVTLGSSIQNIEEFDIAKVAFDMRNLSVAIGIFSVSLIVARVLKLQKRL